MGRYCSPLVSPLGLPSSQPSTRRSGRVGGVALCDADFTGLGGLQPQTLVPPVHCQGLLLSGFSTLCHCSLDPRGRTRSLLWRVWVREVPVLATNHWGLWPHESSSACTFPHCPISMCEDVLCCFPGPGPFRDQVWGLLCSLDHLSQIQRGHAQPTLGTSGGTLFSVSLLARSWPISLSVCG